MFHEAIVMDAGAGPLGEAAADGVDARELAEGEVADSFRGVSPEVAGVLRVSARSSDGEGVGVVPAGFFGDSTHATPSTIRPITMLAGVALPLPPVRLPIRWSSDPLPSPEGDRQT
jgi:hypothetical protein